MNEHTLDKRMFIMSIKFSIKKLKFYQTRQSSILFRKEKGLFEIYFSQI